MSFIILLLIMPTILSLFSLGVEHSLISMRYPIVNALSFLVIIFKVILELGFGLGIDTGQAAGWCANPQFFVKKNCSLSRYQKCRMQMLITKFLFADSDTDYTIALEVTG